MKKGQAYIGGYYYYFDEASGKRVTGWKYISAQGKWVYYNSYGRMVKGWNKISGHWYYFNLVTGARK
ncbi:hypothetical protein CRI84_10990 [Liquorilactobacillus hordei]|nr:hypothetical protein [Liquorilactobacillus hordei]